MNTYKLLGWSDTLSTDQIGAMLIRKYNFQFPIYGQETKSGFLSDFFTQNKNVLFANGTIPIFITIPNTIDYDGNDDFELSWFQYEKIN